VRDEIDGIAGFAAAIDKYARPFVEILIKRLKKNQRIGDVLWLDRPVLRRLLQDLIAAERWHAHRAADPHFAIRKSVIAFVLWKLTILMAVENQIRPKTVFRNRKQPCLIHIKVLQGVVFYFP
jgi:hypothetical protein